MRTTESHSKRPGKKLGLIGLAVVAYPVLAHLSLLAGQRWVGVVFALAVGATLIWSSRHRGRWAPWALAGLLATTIFALGSSRVENLVYLPPIVISLMLTCVFGRTLGSGRTPLITKFATIARGELAPRVAQYTRRVTQMWTIFFALLTVEMTLLAAFAPVELWSLFANGLNYIFAAFVFLAEYGVRRYHLAELEHPGFMQYMRTVRQLDVHTGVHRSETR